MTYLLIPILFAVWAAYVTFIFVEKEESFLKRRIKSAGKKYKTSSRQFLDNILEALKPLTAGNIKDINVKNKIKELLVRMGMIFLSRSFDALIFCGVVGAVG